MNEIKKTITDNAKIISSEEIITGVVVGEKSYSQVVVAPTLFFYRIQ